MNGYIVIVDRKRFEVYANTAFEASEQAKQVYRTQGGRKKYPDVDVYLAEKKGEQVTSVITN